MGNDQVCDSCEKQKAELRVVKSKVIPDVNLLMCKTCISNRYEPRWCLILAGRSYGPKKVKDWINKRRYLGDVISFSEVVK